MGSEPGFQLAHKGTGMICNTRYLNLCVRPLGLCSPQVPTFIVGNPCDHGHDTVGVDSKHCGSHRGCIAEPQLMLLEFVASA